MGPFGEVISRRAFRIWALVVIVGALAVATVMFVGMRSALAAHPEVSLAGSDFEIDTDANLKVDDLNQTPPSIDWASVPQTNSALTGEVRATDLATGQNDNSFVQGTKEDTPVPVSEFGSIPNNKSDLLHFGVYLEENAAGHRFMHMYWHRVQEPTGTTNMDFEFNKSKTLSANGITPVRSEGDVLIQYDLSQGGTRPTLWLSRWYTAGNNHTKADCEAANALPCWSNKVDLTAQGDATGSINTSSIPGPNGVPADSDGLGNISSRTFGEATVDFDAFQSNPNDPCVGFGSAYLKSRSSDSFTAALKDYIAPAPLNIDQCGAIRITKTAKHADTSGNTSPNLRAGFTIRDSNGTQVGQEVFTSATTGTVCVDRLQLGTYTVQETTVPTGYAPDPATNNTKSVTVDNAASCGGTSFGGESVTFTNTPLTNVTVSVDSQVNGGTASTISCVDANGNAAGNATTGANGDGSLTRNNLPPTAPNATLVCTITVDP